MMKFTKRILSVMLSLCLVLCCSIPAFAAETTTTVGTLTIFSSNDGGSSSWNLSGHAFLAFENTSSSDITVGGLTVASGEEITFGTWGNQDAHHGIWYNLESYLINNQNDYANRASLSMSVTQDDVDEINTIIANNDTWALLNNCSSFAVRVWNQVSSITLSAGSPNTPTSLRANIRSKSGYETGRSVQNNTNIGYVSGGEFVPVTVSASARSAAPIVMTAYGVQFIVPINLNPNSCDTEVWHK